MVGMDIPDEAVEAADKVFNDLFEIGQAFGPGCVREMLEAAAPHIAAQAWDEGEVAGQDNRDSNRGYNIEHKSNPYRSQP